MSVIKTFDKEKKFLTGYLVPLWHSDTGPRVDQVYLTTLLPQKVKGPHLHKVRRGLFFCVSGEVVVVTRVDGKYFTHSLKRGDPPVTVPPGVPAALYNPNWVEALVLNMPSPPWRPGEEDEWPVEDWNFHL